MPQRESIPEHYTILADLPAGQSNGVAATTVLHGVPFTFTCEVLRDGLYRTTFTSTTHPLPPYPSVSKPISDLKDGQLRRIVHPQDHIDLVTDEKQVSIKFGPQPLVSASFVDENRPLHEDLPFRSYVVDGSGVAHYTRFDRAALHVGLGEKSAPMDLTGRQFRITATDSFGYDVYRTDPLYKHIPLLITATADGAVAQFSTSHARGTWSIGSEMDGLWGRYKVYRQDYGGLEEYLILGRTLQEVIATYADLVGYPLLVPRWSFGYIAGGYKYAMSDSPPAEQVLRDFAQKLKDHDIPCSAMQLSSGYHVSHEEPKVRNVFCWNRFRFPDPPAWLAEYRQQGLKVIANVKPFLLESHPGFADLKKKNAFFRDTNTGGPGYMRLWSAGGGEGGRGCHLDFTSRAARDWWYAGIRQLIREGVEVPWNDNNEYPLPDDDWELKLDQVTHADQGTKIGLWGRSMQTELMAKASFDALLDEKPTHRPFVLTRSATAGTMRYACSSWSGDNQTSWESMRGANAISLNAGMSLLQCFGHDIGGFEGPQPTPELLLRWVQIGAYSPRFAINCFKTSPEDNLIGEVIEPWMYPEITSLVRAAIKRRYEILPYLYSLSLQSHLTAMPPQRWVGWGFETDPTVWESALLKQGENQYWLGDTLMVGGVFESGKDSAQIYLPQRAGISDGGYLNLNSPFQHLTAGQWVEIDSPWTGWIPLVARVGGAIPIGKPRQTASSSLAAEPESMEKDDYRGVEIFPLPANKGRSECYNNIWLEDDGVSQEASIVRITLDYWSDESCVHVNFARSNADGYLPAWKSLEVILPHNDNRRITSSGEIQAQQRKEDGRQALTIAQTVIK